MTIADLRGREDEARILVGDAQGVPVGWEDGGRLTACVMVERAGDDVRIVAAAGETGPLLDELARIVNAARIIDVDGGVLRTLDATPAADASLGATTLAALERAIRSAWGADTSAHPNSWSADNPALGQCDVTAMMIRELLGGELVIANVVRDGRRLERHVWNRLPGGIDVDLTREQYRGGEQLSAPAVEEPLGLLRARDRYELFAARVREALL